MSDPILTVPDLSTLAGLIARLTELQDRYGDCPVMVDDGKWLLGVTAVGPVDGSDEIRLWVSVDG